MTQTATDKQAQIDRIKKLLTDHKTVAKALLSLKKQKEFVLKVKNNE